MLHHTLSNKPKETIAISDHVEAKSPLMVATPALSLPTQSLGTLFGYPISKDRLFPLLHWGGWIAFVAIPFVWTLQSWGFFGALLNSTLFVLSGGLVSLALRSGYRRALKSKISYTALAVAVLLTCAAMAEVWYAGELIAVRWCFQRLSSVPSLHELFAFGEAQQNERSLLLSVGQWFVYCFDPEAATRASLRHICEADSNIAEAAVAECGTSALEMINAERPDLLLLDVELKDMTGFDVLRSLSESRRPAVIMVAAHTQYESEAVRNGAIDYLTKPVEAKRLATAIERVHQQINPLPIMEKAVSSRAPSSERQQAPLRLMAEHAHRLYFLSVEEVDYIESYGNYVMIHVGEQKYLRRDTIKRLASVLRDRAFEFIQRSILINLARVDFAEKLDHGAFAFTLSCGVRLISKTRMKLVV